MPQVEKAVLAVDAHGGDHGLSVTLPATLSALQQDPGLEVRLVGIRDQLEPALAAEGSPGQSLASRLHLHDADSALPMDVTAISALRKGEGSSLWSGVQLVADGQADACVSGGSTAAMMALGVRLLGMLSGIERPVLMAYIPHAEGFTGALDLGANLSVTERQLVQFAVMGSLTAENVDGISNPRVGLLNVGHEESKGHVTVQAAHALLKEVPINYIGFVEGNDLYSGKVDVAVCDGFSGNLILKASEGLARLAISQLHAAFESSALSRIGGWLASKSLKRVLAGLDPSAHNGAPLLGLRGVVVKSHGHADARAYTQAILEAGQAARKKLPRRIDSLIRQYNLEA